MGEMAISGLAERCVEIERDGRGRQWIDDQGARVGGTDAFCAGDVVGFEPGVVQSLRLDGPPHPFELEPGPQPRARETRAGSRLRRRATLAFSTRSGPRRRDRVARQQRLRGGPRQTVANFTAATEGARVHSAPHERRAPIRTHEVVTQV